MYTRIIPARAGFTTASASAAVAISDHPRSRGVYQTPLRFIYFCMGSSPLAQGLPESRSPTVHRALDHPRSRGVYECPRVFPRPGAGSSPLARGLQHYPHADLMEHRIIPAHAGFTRPVRLRGRAGRDHPRSRGVYLVQDRGDASRFGSSPLARGLLSGEPTVGEPTRIIPARAGFTYIDKWGEIKAKDHPRSRGVYPGPVSYKHLRAHETRGKIVYRLLLEQKQML